jgi:hypothetical protein
VVEGQREVFPRPEAAGMRIVGGFYALQMRALHAGNEEAEQDLR